MIGGVREREVGVIRRHGYWSMIGLSLIFMQIPNLMQMVTIVLFVHLDGEITPSK